MATSIIKTENRGSVRVTADGVKTRSTLLNELYALTDATKITKAATLELYGSIHHLDYVTNSRFDFSYTSVGGGSDVDFSTFKVMSSGSASFNAKVTTGGLSISDISSDVLPAGTTITIKY